MTAGSHGLGEKWVSGHAGSLVATSRSMGTTVYIRCARPAHSRLPCASRVFSRLWESLIALECLFGSARAPLKRIRRPSTQHTAHCT
jgi:hypothetical protein